MSDEDPIITKYKTTINFGNPLGFLTFGFIIGFVVAVMLIHKIDDDVVKNGIWEHNGEIFRLEKITK